MEEGISQEGCLWRYEGMGMATWMEDGVILMASSRSEVKGPSMVIH